MPFKGIAKICSTWVHLHTLLVLSDHSFMQFWSRFIPVNSGGHIYPTLTAISLTPTFHLVPFMASSFSKPTLLLSFSTCVFHIFFGRPCFLLPFTSNSNAFLKTCPSSLLNTCLYHLAPFTFAIWTAVSFNPNISIRSFVLVFSISFAPHTVSSINFLQHFLREIQIDCCCQLILKVKMNSLINFLMIVIIIVSTCIICIESSMWNMWFEYYLTKCLLCKKLNNILLSVFLFFKFSHLELITVDLLIYLCFGSINQLPDES